MSNEFGKILRFLRKQNNDNLIIQAKKIDISISELSLYEAGRKEISLKLIEKLIEVYNLDEETKEKLLNSRIINNENLAEELQIYDIAKQNNSLVFNRKLKEVDPDLISKLREALKND